MVDPNHYFELQMDQRSSKLQLVDKADGATFKSKKCGFHILRWRCIFENKGCDACFKTNTSISEFVGAPQLIHNNHRANDQLGVQIKNQNVTLTYPPPSNSNQVKDEEEVAGTDSILGKRLSVTFRKYESEKFKPLTPLIGMSELDEEEEEVKQSTES